MRRAVQFFFTALFVFSFALVLAKPTFAQSTQAWTGVCVHSLVIDGEQQNVPTIQGLQCLIANILQIAVSGIGLVGFVMLIFGSFKYLMSGGNAKETDDSRKMLTAAVVGLIIALSAFFMLRILADFTGVEEILNFRVPGPATTPDEVITPTP